MLALNWRGKKVNRRLREAQKEAVNATMSAAVLHAKSNHGPNAHSMGRFQNRTSALQGSINITEPAKEWRRGVRGQWGSQDIVYALRIELGFQGKDKLGRVYDQPPFPFLRPAADEEYPKLAGRIKRAFR